MYLADADLGSLRLPNYPNPSKRFNLLKRGYAIDDITSWSPASPWW